jgi:putative two-component system response regulator
MAHILIAEDTPTLLEVMREILQADGHEISVAANGREALAIFEKQVPDLILSDFMMPQMDGMALLQAVRAHPGGQAVPFLFVSARTENTATFQARELGADDYIFKPFGAEDLTRAVRAKLDRRRVVELFDTRSAHVQTVTMLANVIEARDQYTGGHVQRVQRYALLLAHALAWGAEAVSVLEFGALLHDIGKILVPRTVLNKPKKLASAEWALLRRHPEVGAEMLAGVDHLRRAIPYVRHHHERWDGSGYPDGLAGQGIPLEGRMLALADTFDAMTTDRPYRQALPREHALEEIRSRAGTQFDPELTAVFITLPLHNGHA